MKKQLLSLLLVLFFSSMAYAYCNFNDFCEEDLNENSCLCPSDCGVCSGDAPPEYYGLCKQWQCVNQECVTIIKSNCCGNEDCELGENYGNCPADCLPTEVTIAIISPDFSDYFVRGEKVLFKVKVTSHGRKAILADVNISSDFFEKKQLFNDGKHDDDKAFDDVFANSFIVPIELTEGVYPITLDVNFFSVTKTIDYNFSVNPLIETTLVVGDEFFLGDLIEINVETYRKKKLVSIPLDLNLLDGQGRLLFSKQLTSETGIYSTSFRSSLLDEAGVWQLTVQGSDENSNFALVEKSLEVFQPGKEYFLALEVLEPALLAAFEAGSSIPFKVQVTDYKGAPVSGALVKLVTPAKEFFELVEKTEEPGVYSVLVPLAFDISAGENAFKLTASKPKELIELVGSKEWLVELLPAEFNVEVLEPEKLFFESGESLPLKIKLTYPDGERVSNADLSFYLGEQKALFWETEPGIYRSELKLRPEDVGKHALDLNALDAYGNYGSTVIKLEVSGIAFIQELREALPLILGVIAAVIVAGLLLARHITKKKTLSALKKKEKKILSLEKELQEKYFQGAPIAKKEFDRLMAEYESQLADVGDKIKRLKK